MLWEPLASRRARGARRRLPGPRRAPPTGAAPVGASQRRGPPRLARRGSGGAALTGRDDGTPQALPRRLAGPAVALTAAVRSGAGLPAPLSPVAALPACWGRGPGGAGAGPRAALPEPGSCPRGPRGGGAPGPRRRFCVSPAPPEGLRASCAGELTAWGSSHLRAELVEALTGPGGVPPQGP